MLIWGTCCSQAARDKFQEPWPLAPPSVKWGNLSSSYRFSPRTTLEGAGRGGEQLDGFFDGSLCLETSGSFERDPQRKDMVFSRVLVKMGACF